MSIMKTISLNNNNNKLTKNQFKGVNKKRNPEINRKHIRKLKVVIYKPHLLWNFSNNKNHLLSNNNNIKPSLNKNLLIPIYKSTKVNPF